MPLLLRRNKGTSLTNDQLDDNFVFLNGRINDVATSVDTLNADVTLLLDETIPALLDEKQNLNNRLTSLSGLGTTGLLSFVNTETGEITSRTIQASSSNIVVLNGSGVSGNPSIDIGTNVLTNSSTHVLSNKTISGNNNTIESISVTSLVGVLPIANGGTGGSTASAARLSLSALRSPLTNGIVIQTGTDTVTTRQINVTGIGLSIATPDGVAGNPTITSNATALNTPSTIISRDASGNFAAGTITATLNGNALTATTVANGVYTTGSYNNPAWITSLAGSKVTSIPNSSLEHPSLTINGATIILGESVTLSPTALGGTSNNTANTLVLRDSSGNFAAGTITANLIGTATNASSVTNGVYTTGSYSNPSWITALAGTKVTGIPNTSLQNSYIVFNGTTISLGQSVTFPYVVTDGAYSNPSWITSLAGSKVTSIPNSSLQNSAVTVNGVSVALGSSISLNGTQLGGVSINTPSTLVLRDSLGNFAAGTITATLNGNASSATTALSATTAAQATKLATPRTINGVAFDGTANITVSDNLRVLKSGDTMTGQLTLNSAPIVLQNGGDERVRINPQGSVANQPDIQFKNHALIESGNSLTMMTDGNGLGTGSFRVAKGSSKIDGTETYLFTVFNDGKLRADVAAATYAAGLNDSRDIPNKKYVDDLVNISVQGTSSNTPNTLARRDASGNFAAGIITATLNGNASSASTALTANQATKLATARTINGVAFDGTADISITDNTKLALTGGSLTGFLSLHANPTNAYHAATKQYVDSVASAGVGIGFGQNWVNVKLSRALNTTYTNTTGRPLVAYVTCGKDAQYFRAYVGGVLIYENLWHNPSAQMIVPPGATYRVESTTLTNWVELS